MRIVVNGKPRDVAPAATIADVIASLGLRSSNVVVERNGEPVARGVVAATTLEPNDVLEVVRAVQGGST